MYREVRISEKLLVLGYGIILLFMLTHDLVQIGTLNDIDALLQVKTFKQVIISTIINVTQIVLLLGLILIFIGRKYPLWAKLWLVIHPSCIFIGALLLWWIPYFTGYKAAEKVESYQQMFGNTHTFLPVMNGIVPNTIHVIFHTTLLTCIVLTIYIVITSGRRKGLNFNA